MKLIKCHIENFGKLNNFEFNFSDGFNSIKEENGWGKSTFATFIKSMFYGLPSTTKRNLDENERKKYTPWQGGQFGGNIEFKINNKQYRIERFFGKNNSEDSFSIIDLSTGKKTKDYSENIGEEIFGLDEEAFERSSFIPQKILNSSINESISKKLTNLIQGTAENYNYEDAQERLNKKKALLYNSKGTGQIQELENNIEDIISKINELNTSASAINDIQKQVDFQDNEINDLLIQQDKIKYKIKEYSKAQQKVANKELFDKLNKQVLSTKKTIKEKEDVFNNINTSLTEIESFININKAVVKNENKLQVKSENSYIDERYKELVEYFGDEENIPTPEQTKEINDNITRYNTLKNQLENIQTIQINNQENSKKKKLLITLAIVSIVSLLLGAILLDTSMSIAVVLFVIGGIMLLSSGFMYLENMINIKTSRGNNIDYKQLQKDQTEILKLQQKIESFISKFEDIDLDYTMAINNIISNRKEFDNIKQQILFNEKENNILTKTIIEDKNKIEKFLSQFNIYRGNNLSDKLDFLKQTIIEISNLKEQLKKEQEELDNFKKEKNFDIDETAVINVDINELQAKEKEYQNKIDECRDNKSTYISNINRIQNTLSALDDLENEKEILNNTLDKLKKELNAIKNAQEFLKTANESLSTKFLEPMKKGLNKYLKLITNENFENISLDTDFNISFEEYGKYRAVDYYSKGYRNTIDLCMRLALIDALFGKEKPFIVLDDPFVNFDETKVENAKQFLKELSKTYQLIYFSCHKSRC